MEPAQCGSGIMTFYPTEEEFRDPRKLVEMMEDRGAHHFGIARIIPPKKLLSDQFVESRLPEIPLASRNLQVLIGHSGVYTQSNVIKRKEVTARKFRKRARGWRKDSLKPDQRAQLDALLPNPTGTETTAKKAEREAKLFALAEKYYWNDAEGKGDPTYAPDVDLSLCGDVLSAWNLVELKSILNDLGMDISGVHRRPHSYFGSWRTSFAWHTEDMDLYSINIHHYGAPKLWYAILQKDGPQLERTFADFYPESRRKCDAFQRHKTCIVSPEVLEAHSIPVYRVVQNPGEIIVTFPYGYHAGFNLGFNVNEAVNFASLRWIEYGKTCNRCKCNGGAVRIDMRPFVKKYQPERLLAWMRLCRSRKRAGEATWHCDPRLTASQCDDCSGRSDRPLESAGLEDEGDSDQEIPPKRQRVEPDRPEPPSGFEPNVQLVPSTPSLHAPIFKGIEKNPRLVHGGRRSAPTPGRTDDFSLNHSLALSYPHCRVCSYFHEDFSDPRVKPKSGLPGSPDLTDGSVPECTNQGSEVVPPGPHTESQNGVYPNAQKPGSPSIPRQSGLVLSPKPPGPHTKPHNANTQTPGSPSIPQRSALVLSPKSLVTDPRMDLRFECHDSLVTCAKCGLCVHALCYGLTGKEGRSWKCRRKHDGVTVECGKETCPNHFHVTCALDAGLSIRQLDWPTMYSIICGQHPNWRQEGARVLASYGDSEFRKGAISSVQADQVICSVDLDNGPVWKYATVVPGDIKDCDCVDRSGCGSGFHESNSDVKVLWHDGELLDGVFLRWTRGTICKVSLDDPPPDAAHLFWTEDEIFPDDQPELKAVPTMKGKEEAETSSAKVSADGSAPNPVPEK